MCIGAQKAGTTWLYENLKMHPDVRMPPIKEIHYFDEIYHGASTDLLGRLMAKEGINKWWWKEKIYIYFKKAIKKRNLAHLIWYFRYFFFKRNFNWYEAMFDNSQGKLTGDITPDYCILDKKIIELIHTNYPNLKIIYLIRNPVSRAWSALKMRYVKRRNLKIDDIDETLVEEYYREFEEFNNIERTLTNWTSFYPRDQFHIGFYDELVSDPVSFYDKILDYLGLKRVYDSPKLQKKVFRGVGGEMSPRLELILTLKSIEQIRFLNQYVTGCDNKFPANWLIKSEKIISSMK